ncbi:MAG: PEGA domain-containing protein [Methanoregulaceae archaeon]|nr:MAG: PEGA domain-containing protein [Methanoregulaceae archaeon]
MKRSSLSVCLFLIFLLVTAGIPLAAASPTISRVSPETAPNTGDVTVTYTGSGYNEDSSVWMITCDGKSRVSGTIIRVSPTSLTARFSFRGQTLGKYNVWVNSPWTDSYGNYYPQDAERIPSGFTLYQGTGTTYTTTTTGTVTAMTTVTTSVTSGEGDNSVFFETNPGGATVFLNGNEVGTSAFTYYTNQEGVFDVVVKKTGYEDYTAKVTILEGKRVRFYALLTLLASGSTPSATTPANGTPGKIVTTIRKSTLKIPTPLGTDTPVTEESPGDPALALGAAGIAIGLVLLRRR